MYDEEAGLGSRSRKLREGVCRIDTSGEGSATIGVHEGTEVGDALLMLYDEGAYLPPD